MHDNQVIGPDATDALIQKILSVAPSTHALLSDKDVKVALISELRDVGVPVPGIVYRLLVFAFGGCERFLGGPIKSRLKVYIDSFPILVVILQKLIKLQDDVKEKAELKRSLLASLKDDKPINPNIIADEASSLEMIVALHTTKQFEELGDQVTKLGELFKGFHDDLAEQMNQLVAPDLSWSDEAASPEKLTVYQRLQYTSGIDKFLGREDEIQRLHRFAGDPSYGGRVFNFQWMLLTGDAGDGKTRLAYEFTRNELDDLWHKGKLHSTSLKAFDKPAKWRPSRPTFIVIDYVRTVPEEVGDLLWAFCTQAANYEFPVRLLLLERSSDPSWTDKLLPGPADKLVIEQHNFGGKGIQGDKIEPLLPDAIFELMKRRIQIDVPEKKRLLSLAHDVDPLVETPRPLFAIAAAEAIIDARRAGQKLPKKLDLTEVFAGIIQREEKLFWSKIIEYDPHKLRQYKMGLAVATLTQKISLLDLNEDNFGSGTSWLPPISPGHDSVSLAAFGCRDVLWRPMEPDILGEFFLSEQLLRTDLSKEHRVALIEGALSLGERRTVVTLWRLARDFPERFKQLQLEEVAHATVRERVRERVLRSLIMLVGIMTNDVLDSCGASKIFDAVFGREDWNTSRELRIEVLEATVNICHFSGDAGNWDRVAEMLPRLDAVRKAVPQDEEIALYEAMAAFNICTSFGDGDWDRIAEMLSRLDAVRKDFPQDKKIAQEESMAAFNISLSAIAAGDWSRVAEMMARFDALRKAFPQDQEFALHEVMAAFNISLSAIAAGDWSRVAEMMARFDALRKAFPQDQEIALQAAKVDVELSGAAATTGDWGRVAEIWARLDALRKAFPQDQEIALADADATVNISNPNVVAGNWSRVAEIWVRLDAVRKAFPHDQKIALADAKSAINISNAAAETRDWDLITEIVARLDAVRKAFPQDQKIALADAKSAINISNPDVVAGDWSRVAEIWARLDAVRKAFPQDQEIALAAAKVEVNISEAAAAAGDWGLVTKILSRLDAVRKAFSRDREIALADVMAAVILISNSAEGVRDLDCITKIVARLDAVLKAFPWDPEIALEAAKVGLNGAKVPKRP